MSQRFVPDSHDNMTDEVKQGTSRVLELTNSVDRDSGCKPLLDVTDHAVGDLGVVRRIEVVVVQVEDGARVSCAGSLKSDGDEVLAQDLGKNGRAERAVLVEDLVADVLEHTRKYFVL